MRPSGRFLFIFSKSSPK